MPKVPLYDYQGGIPTSSRPFIHDATKSGDTWTAVQHAAKDLGNRAEQFQKERDVLGVSEALAALGDEERSFTKKEIEENQGEKATGSVQRADEFYKTAAQKHGANLTARGQKMYNDRVLQMRDGLLDRLSGNEAQQHQKHKQSVLDKSMATLDAGIKEGYSELQLSTQINMINEQLKALHPGVDTSNMELQVKQKAYSAWLWQNAAKDPEGVRSKLEQNKDIIGAVEAEKIKDFADKQDMEQNTQRWFDTLKTENRNNYAAMDKAVDGLSVSSKVKEALHTKVRSDFATQKAFRDEARHEAGRAEQNKIVDAFAAKDYDRAFELAKGAKYMEPSTREHYIIQSQKMTEAIISGKQGDFAKNSEKMESWVNEAIELYPHLITKGQISALAGYGLSGDKAAALEKRLEEVQSKPNPRLTMTVDQMKRDQSDKLLMYGNDPKQSSIRLNEAIDAARAFQRQFPDKDVYNDFYLPYREQLGKGKIREAFAEASKKVGKEGYFPTQPKGAPEDFGLRHETPTEKQDFYLKWLRRDITREKPYDRTEVPKVLPPDPTIKDEGGIYKWWTGFVDWITPERRSTGAGDEAEEESSDLDFNIR